MFCLFKQAWPETTEYLHAGPERFLVDGRLPPRFRPDLWFRKADYDLVVAHTARGDSRKADLLLRLLSPRRRGDAMSALGWDCVRQWQPRMGGVPLAVLDMHDDGAIHARDLALLKASRRYFKRELPPDAAAAFPAHLRGDRLAAQLAKIMPISLGLSADVVRDLPASLPAKSVDVFFAGSPSHGEHRRAPGLAQLARLAAAGIKVDIARERLPRPLFLERCARARIVWSPEGLGWDCFRHYEAAACASVALINEPTIQRYRPLREDVHAIYYSPEGDGLTRAVMAALEDPARLAAMGADARAHVLRHHTHDALCTYVAEACL